MKAQRGVHLRVISPCIIHLKGEAGSSVQLCAGNAFHMVLEKTAADTVSRSSEYGVSQRASVTEWVAISLRYLQTGMKMSKPDNFKHIEIADTASTDTTKELPALKAKDQILFVFFNSDNLKQIVLAYAWKWIAISLLLM